MADTRHGHYIAGSSNTIPITQVTVRCGGQAKCIVCLNDVNQYWHDRREADYAEAIKIHKINNPHELIRYFSFDHLHGDLCNVSEEFHELAEKLDAWLKPGTQKDLALQQLLLAKDAAVRSALDGIEVD